MAENIYEFELPGVEGVVELVSEKELTDEQAIGWLKENFARIQERPLTDTEGRNLPKGTVFRGLDGESERQYIATTGGGRISPPVTERLGFIKKMLDNGTLNEQEAQDIIDTYTDSVELGIDEGFKDKLEKQLAKGFSQSGLGALMAIAERGQANFDPDWLTRETTSMKRHLELAKKMKARDEGEAVDFTEYENDPTIDFTKARRFLEEGLTQEQLDAQIEANSQRFEERRKQFAQGLVSDFAMLGAFDSTPEAQSFGGKALSFLAELGGAGASPESLIDFGGKINATTRLGRFARRALLGAAEGAAGEAVIQPVLEAQATAVGEENNEIANVALGALFGAGLRTVAGTGADLMPGSDFRKMRAAARADAEAKGRLAQEAVDKANAAAAKEAKLKDEEYAKEAELKDEEYAKAWLERDELLKRVTSGTVLSFEDAADEAEPFGFGSRTRERKLVQKPYQLTEQDLADFNELSRRLGEKPMDGERLNRYLNEYRVDNELARFAAENAEVQQAAEAVRAKDKGFGEAVRQLDALRAQAAAIAKQKEVDYLSGIDRSSKEALLAARRADVAARAEVFNDSVPYYFAAEGDKSGFIELDESGNPPFYMSSYFPRGRLRLTRSEQPRLPGEERLRLTGPTESQLDLRRRKIESAKALLEKERLSIQESFELEKLRKELAEIASRKSPAVPVLAVRGAARKAPSSSLVKRNADFREKARIEEEDRLEAERIREEIRKKLARRIGATESASTDLVERNKQFREEQRRIEKNARRRERRAMRDVVNEALAERGEAPLPERSLTEVEQQLVRTGTMDSQTASDVLTSPEQMTPTELRGVLENADPSMDKPALVEAYRDQFLPYESTVIEPPAVEPDAPARDVSKAEQMTREEYGIKGAPDLAEIQKRRPRSESKLFGQKGPTPEQKKAYDVSVKKWNAEHRKALKDHREHVEASNKHFEAIKNAIDGKQTLYGDVLADYPYLSLPEGYVKQGDLYVYQPAKQAPAAKAKKPSPFSSKGGSINLEPLVKGVQLIAQGFDTFTNWLSQWSKGMSSRALRAAPTFFRRSQEAYRLAGDVFRNKAIKLTDVTLTPEDLNLLTRVALRGIISARKFRNVVFGSPLSTQMLDLLANQQRREAKVLLNKYEFVTRDMRKFLKDKPKAMQDAANNWQKIPEGPAKTRALGAFPIEVQRALLQQREAIDGMTDILVSEGVVFSDPLIDILQNNKGEYLRQSYRAFTNPKEHKPSQRVIQAARTYVKNAWKVTDNEADAIIRSMLSPETGPAFFEGKGTIGGSKVGVLMKKNQALPKEIKELLGEIIDPVEAGGRTLTSMIDLLASDRAQRTIVELGLREGLFSRTRSLRHSEQLVPDSASDPSSLSSVRYRHMEGIYAAPEAAAALRKGLEGVKQGQASVTEAVGQLYFSLVGLTKFLLVPLNIATYVPNYLGSMSTFVNAGGFRYLMPTIEAWRISDIGAPVKQFKRSTSIISGEMANVSPALRTMFTRPANMKSATVKAWRDRINAERAILIKYGIIDQNITAQDLISTVEKARLRVLNDAPKKITSAASFFFNLGDNVPRAMLFWGKVDDFRKLFPNEGDDQIYKRAAKETLEETMNYAALPPNLKKLATLGLPIQTFVAFPYAYSRSVMLTARNGMRQLKEGIASGNADLIKIGMAKLTGITASYAAYEAVSENFNSMHDFTTRHMEAVKQILNKEYLGNQRLIAASDIEADGTFKFASPSYLAPPAIVADPIALGRLAAEDTGSTAEGVERGIEAFAENFIGFGVGVEPAAQAVTGLDQFGNKIYKPGDTMPIRVAKGVKHVAESTVFNSGAIGEARKWYSAVTGEPLNLNTPAPTVKDQIKRVLGFRVQEKNLFEALDNKARNLKRDWDSASDDLNRLSSAINWDSEDAQREIVETKRVQEIVFQDLLKTREAAMLVLPNGERKFRNSLLASGFTPEVISMVMDQNYQPSESLGSPELYRALSQAREAESQEGMERRLKADEIVQRLAAAKTQGQINNILSEAPKWGPELSMAVKRAYLAHKKGITGLDRSLLSLDPGESRGRVAREALLATPENERAAKVEEWTREGVLDAETVNWMKSNR